MTEKLTVPVCFLMTPSMHEGMQKAAEKKDLKISQLLRQVFKDFLSSEVKSEMTPMEELPVGNEEGRWEL
jgi:hypothetical protein